MSAFRSETLDFRAVQDAAGGDFSMNMILLLIPASVEKKVVLVETS